jgi:aspartate aminotransferase-like enzyme
MNVTLAEGQDQLKGKAIRIAHVGYMGAFDVITAIAALEMALRKFGAEIPFGHGVAAAEEILMEALTELSRIGERGLRQFSFSIF